MLKPGQCFAAYEWCITDSFDPKNEEHQRIKVILMQLILLLIPFFLIICSLHTYFLGNRVRLSSVMGFLILGPWDSVLKLLNSQVLRWVVYIFEMPDVVEKCTYPWRMCQYLEAWCFWNFNKQYSRDSLYVLLCWLKLQTQQKKMILFCNTMTFFFCFIFFCFSLSNFRVTAVGRFMTRNMVRYVDLQHFLS